MFPLKIVEETLHLTIKWYKSDIIEMFNFTDSSGFDYTKVYQTVESSIKSKLDNNTYYGRESTVVLLIPRSAPRDDEKNFLEGKRQTIKTLLPGSTFQISLPTALFINSFLQI